MTFDVATVLAPLGGIEAGLAEVYRDLHRHPELGFGHAFAAAVRAGTVERDIPSNHQPTFAPVIEPTLTTGVTALTATALGRPRRRHPVTRDP